MDIAEIVKDAIQYPLSDFKKFLILGTPNLMITIFTLVLMIRMGGIIENAPNFTSLEAFFSSELFINLMASIVVLTIVFFFISLFISGIGLSVTRETLKYKNELPKFEPGKNFIDGIKVFILGLIYTGIPVGIINVIISNLVLVSEESIGLLIIIFYLIELICLIFFGILYIGAFGRLAETDSLSEALKFKEVYNKTREIGWSNFVAILVINIIFVIIITILGTIISFIIPYLGIFISLYLITTYITLYQYRTYGLLYRNDQVYNQQGYAQQYNPNNKIEFNTEPQQDVIDFQATKSVVNKPDEELNVIESEQVAEEQNITTEEIVHKVDEHVHTSADGNLKKCGKCGFSNPDFVNICVNCGNNLE